MFIRFEYQIASSIYLKNWLTGIDDLAQDVSDYYLCFQLSLWFTQILYNYNVKIIWQVKSDNKKRLNASDFNLDDDTMFQQPYTLSALNNSSCFLFSMCYVFIWIFDLGKVWFGVLSFFLFDCFLQNLIKCLKAMDTLQS